MEDGRYEPGHHQRFQLPRHRGTRRVGGDPANKARPVVVRKLFVLPVILVVVGIGSLNSAASKGGTHFSSSDATWLAIDLAATIVFGVLRGASVRLYPQDGALWRKGTWVTLVGWVLSFAARGAMGCWRPTTARRRWPVAPSFSPSGSAWRYKAPSFTCGGWGRVRLLPPTPAGPRRGEGSLLGLN